MNVQAYYTDDTNKNGALIIDSVRWDGPLPPNAGDLREIYEAWIAQGNMPAPYSPPPAIPPRSVAMWRARTIMKVTPWSGGSLFGAVTAAISAISDPLQKAAAEEALERGDVFDRDGVFVPLLAQIVGVNEEQLDTLMAQASALPA